MSLVTRTRTLILLALSSTVVVAPACDEAARYEALGLSDEDLAAMSAEELDALAAEDEEALEPAFHRPEVEDALALPRQWTHTERPGHLKGLENRPRPTHGVGPATVEVAAGPETAGPCLPHDDGVAFAAK